MLRLVDDPGGCPHGEGGRPGLDAVVAGDEMTGVTTNIISAHPPYPVLDQVLSLPTAPN